MRFVDRVGQTLAVCVAAGLGALAAPVLAAVTLAPARVTIAAGATATVEVRGATGGLTVQSSRAALVTAALAEVTVTGATLTLAGLAAGRAAVTVRDAGAAPVTLPVTVVRAMTVTPATMSLSVGSTGTIADANSATRRLGATTANAGIASVAATGARVAVTGVAPGSTTIVVTDGTSTVAVPVAVVAAAGPAFRGNVVLGAPTATSIRANVYAGDQGGTVEIAFGTTPGAYPSTTGRKALQAGQPLELELRGLAADTRYHYRLRFQQAGQAETSETDEAAFRTVRAAGSTFTFALQGDSHPERAKSMFDADLYARTLAAAAADAPDFYLAMGDDFSVDTIPAASLDRAAVEERYVLQRPWLGVVGRAAPIYLVNGNHEQAARCNLDGTPDNVAAWAQNARNAYYPEPAPDAFYTGNAELVPHIGLLRNYYAWTWGDALFVVIDPYWSSPVCVDNVLGGGAKRASMWDVTHGDAQYQWLKTTLEHSRAKYKFVFAHHVMGTGRGGIELADLWEWGGADAKGVDRFDTYRPAWTMPIHDLFVRNGVTIFFQGHDHIWAHQQLDGITYQTLSVPADPNYALYNGDAYRSGDVFPGTGYTRVNVAPGGVTVEYVRTYLPADEGPGRTSGAVAFSYTIPAPPPAP